MQVIRLSALTVFLDGITRTDFADTTYAIKNTVSNLAGWHQTLNGSYRYFLSAE